MMEANSQVDTRNEGEDLLLRRTQGDLLEKLKQLQQWRQQREEHLLQDKEKQLNLLRDKERRLQAVQEYQRKILENNNMPTFGSNGSPLYQVKPAGFYNGTLSRPVVNAQPSENATMLESGATMSRFNPPMKTVLLSPQHFKATSSIRNTSYDSPVVKPQNQMLLTQKLQLPSTSDDDLSQFTESDGGSVGGIEGIREIEDTPSEVSSDNEDDLGSDHEVDNNNTLVHDDDHHYKHDDDIANNDCDIDGNDDIDHDDDDNHDIGDNDDIDSYNDDQDNDEDVDQDNDDQDIDGIDDIIYDDHDEDIDKQSLDHDINSKPSFDDVPIKPGLGVQTQTFEELLNQQLQAEQNHKHKETRQVKPIITTKRTFLKKGEGLARFGMKTKTDTKPTTLQEKNSTNNVIEHKGPVTRKTATAKDFATTKQAPMPAVTEATVKQRAVVNHSALVNLSDRPQFDARRSRVAQSIQQTGGPITRQSLSHESDHEKQPFSPKKVQFNTRHSHGVDIEDVSEGESSSEDGDIEERAGESGAITEDSFQVRMKKWDELEVVEKRELNEFELLEEAAAANCSLSSNSSTVLRFLGKNQGQHRADINNNMLGAHQLKWNVVPKEAHEVDNVANRTLTEENLDDDGDDTLKEPEVISVRSSLALSDGFDDTRTWDDHDALDVSDITDDVTHALNTSTPNEKKRRAHDQNRKLVTSSSTPPTSAFVTKLFPQLKAKNETSRSQANQKQPVPQQIQPAPLATAVRLDASSGTDCGLNPGLNSGLNSGMSNAVRDKLRELENEIEKFREENVALHKLREEREKDLQELQKERTLFENYKTEELQRLEKFKVEEEKRLRRDKRVFEQYQKASRALPDKKEREEITSLKSKINELQEDLKLRESRWSAAATRYKDRINNLEKENREMREEVKLLEKQNLEHQKVRELLQQKAFEKKKLKKPDAGTTELHNEIPSKRSPMTHVAQNIKQKNEITLNEDEKLYTAPKIVSSPETETALAATTEMRGTEKMNEDDSRAENKRDKTREHSPPTKQVSSKSVRFKDDGLEEEKQVEILPKQLSHSDGKREIINPDGSRVVTFTNGTRKEISADGLSVVVTFFNGDLKQIFPDERIEYYYAEVQTTHTTYPDGLEVLHFPSNQIEKHYPDGTKEIIFPDQTVKYLYTSGAEECVFTDGTVERTSVDGGRIIEFPNGQRETHTKLFKKREYPDGTVKTVYTDGRQETRYASGRLRVKDSEGRLLVDTAEQNIQEQQGLTS